MKKSPYPWIASVWVIVFFLGLFIDGMDSQITQRSYLVAFALASMFAAMASLMEIAGYRQNERDYQAGHRQYQQMVKDWIKSHGRAAAYYLEAFAWASSAKARCSTPLDFSLILPGLSYLAYQVKEVAEENILLQQGWLSRKSEDSQEEEEFARELEERSNYSRQRFWYVVNTLRSHINSSSSEVKSELEILYSIKSWKDLIDKNV